MKEHIKNLQKLLNCSSIDKLAEILRMERTAIFKAQNRTPKDKASFKFLLIEKLLAQLTAQQINRCLSQLKTITQ